jgi:Family of unknown function (DUF5670)
MPGMMSPAKAQRRKALPRFKGSALRFCAWVRDMPSKTEDQRPKTKDPKTHTHHKPHCHIFIRKSARNSRKQAEKRRHTRCTISTAIAFVTTKLGTWLTKGGNEMLWTIFVILLVLWLLGVVSSYTIGGFIHLLLVLALVVLLINIIGGRRTVV